MSKKTVLCPNCGARIVWDAVNSPHRPFCSERCRMSDLNGWFEENHVIPGPVLDDESLISTTVHDPDNPAND